MKLLKNYSEWEFLPVEDLNRKTIEIFSDLNNAKSSCDKEQKIKTLSKRLDNVKKITTIENNSKEGEEVSDKIVDVLRSISVDNNEDCFLNCVSQA